MEQYHRAAAPSAGRRANERRFAALRSAKTPARSGSGLEKEPHHLRRDHRQNHSLEQAAHMHKELVKDSLRQIPSVDKLVGEIGDCDVPRPVIVAVVRRVLALMRKEKKIPNGSGVRSRVRAAIDAVRLAKIQPVINGTGIIIHTNLGRAPLGPVVVESLTAIAQNYCNLEFDLNGGERS